MTRVCVLLVNTKVGGGGRGCCNGWRHDHTGRNPVSHCRSAVGERGESESRDTEELKAAAAARGPTHPFPPHIFCLSVPFVVVDGSGLEPRATRNTFRLLCPPHSRVNKYKIVIGSFYFFFFHGSFTTLRHGKEGGGGRGFMYEK